MARDFAENEKLVTENMHLKTTELPSLKDKNILGDGILPLVISSIRQLTPRIRAYELRDPKGNELPLITAGAHLQIPVLMQDKTLALRQYSICSNPAQRDLYEIAVLREDAGRGGSIALHEFFYLGLQLNCELPTNHFHLHSDASPAILIAGGIGITPIKPMAQTLSARGRRLQLHYAGRSLKEMAFSDCLQREYGSNFFAYPASENKRLDIMNLLGGAPHNAQFYVCGPRKLIDEVFNCATLLGITRDRIQSEQFTLTKVLTDKAVVVELARSNKIINVSADQPVLAALRNAGAKVNFDCCVGDCGACAVKVIEGEVEHRDHVLSDKDRAEGMMCICVSRAKTETLMLDL